MFDHLERWSGGGGEARGGGGVARALTRASRGRSPRCGPGARRWEIHKNLCGGGAGRGGVRRASVAVSDLCRRRGSYWAMRSNELQIQTQMFSQIIMCNTKKNTKLPENCSSSKHASGEGIRGGVCGERVGSARKAFEEELECVETTGASQGLYSDVAECEYTKLRRVEVLRKGGGAGAGAGAGRRSVSTGAGAGRARRAAAARARLRAAASRHKHTTVNVGILPHHLILLLLLILTS
ncbi:hypothetical protein RR46_03995 [Papilio xuthus]|uniref:Uncharacterized protein n=1 Tax=Papilio xuthus TaxID=66420 RepID=A0A194QHX5_PAPXU|nr:hypothetical protein RR46_03995 [Papilio xuthus]